MQSMMNHFISPLLASRADDSQYRFEGLVSEYEGKQGLLNEWFCNDLMGVPGDEKEIKPVILYSYDQAKLTSYSYPIIQALWISFSSV